jgi:hypothetical protein
MNDIIVSYNQSQDCVCFGTNNGFYVFSINPFKKSLAREIRSGISIVKILYKTNIILFVGRENIGDFSNSKLILWDDANRKVIGDIQFRERILNAELNKEIIVVSTSKKIYIYKFENMECIKTIATVNNHDGLFSIGGEKSDYIVYNGNEIGSIGITKIYEDYYREIIYDNPDSYFNDDDFELTSEQEKRIEEIESEIEDYEIQRNELDPDREDYDDLYYDFEKLIDDLESEKDDIVPDTSSPTDDMVESKVDEFLSDVEDRPLNYIREYGLNLEDFIDMDELIEGLVHIDGYGSMNSYDGDYDAININRKTYYIMRIN